MSIKIDQDLNRRANQIVAEMNDVVLEREQLNHLIVVVRIMQGTLLMTGPGGAAKTMVARNFFTHLANARLFEANLNPTSDPTELVGARNIKTLVEEGVNHSNITGMLPTATDAFIDEIMNANAPVKKSLLPIMNERVFVENGVAMECPLRFMIAGTTDNNADTDPQLAPFFDRLHVRVNIEYLKRRENKVKMVAQAIARMAKVGRGVSTSTETAQTTMTVAEFDQAHEEALALDIEDDVLNMFFDIRDELESIGVIVSNRREVEGMAAVLANAWVRNHPTVQATDLDVLANMWWSLQEDEDATRKIVLGAANPAEKQALELLDELDKLKADLAESERSQIPDPQKREVAVQTMVASKQMVADAKQYLADAELVGAATARIQEVIERAQAFDAAIYQRVFHITPNAFKR